MRVRGDYKVELWYRGKKRIGNIRPLVYSLQWTKVRNGLDSIDFSLKAREFDLWCESVKETRLSALEPLNVDVRIMVRGTYVLGATIIDTPPNFNQDEATIQVKCDGFKALLARRRLTKNYSNQYTGAIVQDAISTVQSATNGDLGIVFNPLSYMGNSQTRQDTYTDQDVGDILGNRAVYVSDPYDWQFSADRSLRLYSRLGNYRPDVVVTYPAQVKGSRNADSMTMDFTGSNVANRIIGTSMNGTTTLRSVQDDTASQNRYGIIEDTVQFQNISNQATLDERTKAELAARKDLFMLPKFTMDGSQFRTDEMNVGDSINVTQEKYQSFAYASMVRVERMEVSVSQEDKEDVTITVDVDRSVSRLPQLKGIPARVLQLQKTVARP